MHCHLKKCTVSRVSTDLADLILELSCLMRIPEQNHLTIIHEKHQDYFDSVESTAMAEI